MENNNQKGIEILLNLVRLAKAKKSKVLERNELDSLDNAIKTIKKVAEKGELIGYLAVGIDKNGNTVQTCCGRMADEMLADLHKEIIKRNISLGETILSKLELNLENESTKSGNNTVYIIDYAHHVFLQNGHPGTVTTIVSLLILAENRKEMVQEITDFIWENLVEKKDEK